MRTKIEHLKPTVGLAFDLEGNPELVDRDLRSEQGAEASEIDRFLRNSPRFPRQRRGDVPIAAAAHVEAKVAMEMRKRGIRHLVLVINNPRGVCRGDWGCGPAVRAILPRGHSITVWVPGAAVRYELHGGSPTS
ncbi:DddA-like double-stranded DNA deaminase toxin [Saccharopolyspora oryzae]|uniref:DddA-like double-stranded DNA deaminase toxin n=1 Tax=Saccharopolyspora oryzae TaxID=2997343 RepID=UPI0038CD5AB5